MIVLDTHIWIWWVHGDATLPAPMRALLDSSEQTGLGVSAISCWEVAKLVERQRLTLPCPVSDWIQQALSYPGVRLLDLSPRVCVESTQLPGPFHRDPATKSSWRRRGFLMRHSSPWTRKLWPILMSGWPRRRCREQAALDSPFSLPTLPP